jgi:hypothetical protein
MTALPTFYATLKTLPPLADYCGAIKRAAADPALRKHAAGHFGFIMSTPEKSPLTADHGDHHPRASDCGRCSLEYASDVHGLHDLERDSDTRLMLDNGSIMGAWLACLLGAAMKNPEDGSTPVTVLFEHETTYRGVKGHCDALVCYLGEGRYLYDPVEFKTTRGGGEIKPAHERAPYQCQQTACYAAAPEIRAERFTVITLGANVGSSRAGMPYPKMRADSYVTADFLPELDTEIERLTRLTTTQRYDLLVPENMTELADATAPFRCASCNFGLCARNTNSARFSL